MPWEPHWHWWCRHAVALWAAQQVAPEPEPGPSEWEIQKSRNRLARQVERIGKQQWIPKFAHRVNGRAVRELQEAYTLLGTSVEGVTQVDLRGATEGER